MQAVKLIRAGTVDIPEIRRLAGLVWNQYYPAIISQEQIDYMLGLMYSPESLNEQLGKGAVFYFITNGGPALGFISVSPEKREAWFIHKFYIDQSHAARGIGSAALAALIAEIRPRSMKLTVNRQNYRSINFYFKNGFRIERVADFDIGNGYVMNDFVMVWNGGFKLKPLRTRTV